jgi:MFS family permease
MAVVPAVAAAVAAPLLALCSARLERRRVLVGLSALVVVSDVIAGLAPGIGVMLAARAVLGMCVGGFWVFGAGAAISLVSEQARGTAMAVVSSGIFIATVASLPAASLIGTLTTWRAAFAVAAVFAVIAVAAQLAAVPRQGTGGRVRCRAELDGPGDAGQRRRRPGPVRLRAARLAGRRLAAGGVIYDASGPGGGARAGCGRRRRRVTRPAGPGRRGHQRSVGRLGRSGPRRGREAPAPPGTTDGAGKNAQRTR